MSKLQLNVLKYLFNLGVPNRSKTLCIHPFSVASLVAL
jgi:hypothetical protein